MSVTSPSSLSISTRHHGTIQDKDLYKITMKNDNLLIEITNLGCCIMSICTPDRNGVQKNIVTGFKEPYEYRNNPNYFGVILGRYANRIAGGSFSLDGENVVLTQNDGTNQLHGGFEGFNKKIWSIGPVINDEDKVSVAFEYLSPDGEEGYPGNLGVGVTYTLNKKNQLCIEYQAETDKATPVNLSNHSYFNLTGFDTPVITGHILQINATRYTEKDEKNIPTGKLIDVLGTPLDFTTPIEIGSHIEEFPRDKGFDHNFILKEESSREMLLAARLLEPVTGRTLKVYTDQFAIQLYTANSWDQTIFGSQGKYYQKHGAVALETQASPDSPNQPLFPNTILYPGEHYYSTTIYEFGVETDS